ncbi:MAG: putative kinase inhibitor [Micavibrio sp.]|nr:putative kinase inhibitor [Micavibrio sp.]
MREILPKIIGGVVLLSVVGGGAMMMTRNKNTAATGPVPVAAPTAVMTAPPPVPEEQARYKRDMLGYDDTVTAAATPPKVVAAAVVANAPPPAIPAENSGRAKLQVGKTAGAIKLSSIQLKAGEKISLYYTCNQKNVSPPLTWSNAPSGTKSFVILMEGPDRGRGEPLQWGVYNIPASQTSLGEALPKIPMDDKGIGQAMTEAGPVGYVGPCSPKGAATFVFSIYALDAELKLHGGATRNELINAMNGHIIDMMKLPVTHYFRL